jgi:putative membrane protein
MSRFFELLWGTVALRPYVFVFLGAYLVLAGLHLGGGRTLLFLVLGYVIAWLAELCSIHYGFPFGMYYYIQTTINQELWVAGVPFMDSLSYVFLAYASYTTALLAVGRGSWRGRLFQLDEDEALRKSWATLILGAVLMMTLDVVIDPLALRGSRWFLGQIYGYPDPGVYFGVPLSNFMGWFLVALIMIGVLQDIATRPFKGRPWDWGRRRFPGQAFLGPGLYLGILGFNLFMTFWIGEYCLGWVGIFIFLPFLTWLVAKVSRER